MSSYEYKTRGHRGSSQMDVYEDHYEHGGKYNEDYEVRWSTCGQCSKNCLFFVNFLMLLVGIALIGISVFIQENEDEDYIGFGEVDPNIIYTTIGSGVLIVLLSLFGCVGAFTHSKCLLIIFIILLILCMLLEIVAVIFIFIAQDDLKKFAES